ncbi:GNAT family N-acetyltransferase [Pullulanibacillus sp. KACC 23026]|uniref:GNAT family N-acetyltransferase n=1 Tax=Pullulanibacillus sp. KACC 23026 TaxID=3028315 RepID=UPI0023AF3171|nr:GNAT family N-acetyltransferase [Pullulanibacillus sp. KACC 23026]WEG12020.1 GNAT family N-acetyltransferase [Pullulanibacillus sp. KACC 23026]
MSITVEQVDYEKKTVLRHLIELYNYDFSEFTNDDVNEFGLYDYKYLDNYWNEPHRFPFFIKVNDKYAGFALVRKIKKDNSSDNYYSMAEFFIMKKYRGMGVGRISAINLFEKFKGNWEVSVITENKPAQTFWEKIISKYSYTENKNEGGDTIFSFKITD